MKGNVKHFESDMLHDMIIKHDNIFPYVHFLAKGLIRSSKLNKNGKSCLFSVHICIHVYTCVYIYIYISLLMNM